MGAGGKLTYVQLDSLPAVENIVTSLYEKEGEDFFTVCHKRNGTPKECIDDTLNSFSKDAKIFGFFIGEENSIAAYFGVASFGGKEVLEGFHVAKEYRTKEFMELFWKLVHQMFKGPIHIGVLDANWPARKHLVRNGFEEKGTMVDQGKRIILLIKN
jgi:hypothetical protein